MTEAAAAATPTPLHRNRSFQLLNAGWFVSNITGRGVEFVIPLITLALTGSGKAVGLVGAAGALGMVLGGLPAGAVADRHNRKKVLVGAVLVEAVTIGTVAAAAWFDAMTVAHLTAAAVIVGVAASLVMAAGPAAVRTVVPAEQLGQASSVSQARQALAGTVGAPLGGLWLGISRAAPFLAGVVGCLFAAVAVAVIPNRLDAPRKPDDQRGSPLRDTVEGLRFIRRDGTLSVVVMIAVIMNFAMNGAMLVTVLQRQQAGWSPGRLGFLETAMSVGMVLGAVASGFVVKRVRGALILLVCTAAFCGTLVGLATSTGFLWSLVVVLLASLVLPSANVVIMTYQMLITPPELQGRVGATMGTLAMAAMPAAPMLGGFLLDGIGAAWTVVVFAAVMAVAIPLQLASRALRAMPLLREVEPAGSATGPDSGVTAG